MLVVFLMGYLLFLEFLFIIYRSYMYVVFMVGVERVIRNIVMGLWVIFFGLVLVWGEGGIKKFFVYSLFYE